MEKSKRHIMLFFISYFSISIFLNIQIFNCNGSVRINQKTGKESIALSGDHRDEIAEFLIYEGIGTKESIKIHGAEL